MATYLLKFRKNDRHFFEALLSGKKTIETRAATPKYRAVRTGDNLEFLYGQTRLVRKVKKTLRFKSVEEMIEKIGWVKVMPFARDPEAVKRAYFSFPGYREKIGRFGLVAFFLVPPSVISVIVKK